MAALSFAFANAGNSIAARIAMMAITTNNSISVNAVTGSRSVWFSFITGLLGIFVAKLKRMFFIRHSVWMSSFHHYAKLFSFVTEKLRKCF